jgi:nuclear GTP-binding protein
VWHDRNLFAHFLITPFLFDFSALTKQKSTMVAKKRASKRQTMHQKYKIKKRVKDHHSKLKKGTIVGHRKGKTADNRIPSAWPYKAELLGEIQRAKDKLEQTKADAKEKRADLIRQKRLDMASSLLKTAEENNMDYEEEESEEEEEDVPASASLGQNSRRSFLGELRKIVENADVLLHVLDARDPIGTKSTAIEEMILSHHGKKLVFVLNKADLVPRNILMGWLTYLRQSHPTIPFKCNTQNQKGNLGRAAGKVGAMSGSSGMQSNQTIGADELLGLLKNYCRTDVKSKSVIAVGVVGFPNVGKSSLINSLMRSRAVNVSSTPGFTKVMQEVILDKNIRLLDSPGVVFADGDASSTVLRNCINVEEMEDVITPIEIILQRCPAPYLMELYGVSKFNAEDPLSFLALVARSTGKLKKGGIPNVEATAKTILHDWNNGKIKYYCNVPELDTKSKTRSVAKVVPGFSKQLDIDNMADADIRVLEALDTNDDVAYIPMESAGAAEGGLEEEGGMDCEEEEEEPKKTTKKKSQAAAASKSKSTKSGRTSRSASKAGSAYSFTDDFTYSK